MKLKNKFIKKLSYYVFYLSFILFTSWSFSGTIIEFKKCLKDTFERFNLTPRLMDLSDPRLSQANHCDIACAINLYQIFALSTDAPLIQNTADFSNSMAPWLLNHGINVNKNLNAQEFALVLQKMFLELPHTSPIKVKIIELSKKPFTDIPMDNFGGIESKKKLALVHFNGKIFLPQGHIGFTRTALVTEADPLSNTITLRLAEYSDTPLKMKIELIPDFKRDQLTGAPIQGLQQLKLTPVDTDEIEGEFILQWVVLVDYS